MGNEVQNNSISVGRVGYKILQALYAEGERNHEKDIRVDATMLAELLDLKNSNNVNSHLRYLIQKGLLEKVGSWRKSKTGIPSPVLRLCVSLEQCIVAGPGGTSASVAKTVVTPKVKKNDPATRTKTKTVSEKSDGKEPSSDADVVEQYFALVAKQEELKSQAIASLRKRREELQHEVSSVNITLVSLGHREREQRSSNSEAKDTQTMHNRLLSSLQKQISQLKEDLAAANQQAKDLQVQLQDADAANKRLVSENQKLQAEVQTTQWKQQESNKEIKFDQAGTMA